MKGTEDKSVNMRAEPRLIVNDVKMTIVVVLDHRDQAGAPLTDAWFGHHDVTDGDETPQLHRVTVCTCHLEKEGLLSWSK